jgi:hypothetical protein
MHERQREERGEVYTVTGRGAAGTACHVGDLRETKGPSGPLGPLLRSI